MLIEELAVYLNKELNEDLVLTKSIGDEVRYTSTGGRITVNKY